MKKLIFLLIILVVGSTHRSVMSVDVRSIFEQELKEIEQSVADLREKQENFRKSITEKKSKESKPCLHFTTINSREDREEKRYWKKIDREIKKLERERQKNQKMLDKKCLKLKYKQKQLKFFDRLLDKFNSLTSDEKYAILDNDTKIVNFALQLDGVFLLSAPKKLVRNSFVLLSSEGETSTNGVNGNYIIYHRNQLIDYRISACSFQVQPDFDANKLWMTKDNKGRAIFIEKSLLIDMAGQIRAMLESCKN